MELTDLITALGGSAGVIAIVKALFTDKATRAITDDRKLSKENYDSRFVKLETRCDQLDKRMDEGLDRFQQLDERLDKISETLCRMEGKLSVYIDSLLQRRES